MVKYLVNLFFQRDMPFEFHIPVRPFCGTLTGVVKAEPLIGLKLEIEKSTVSLLYPDDIVDNIT